MIELKLIGTNALLPTPERALTAATLTCQGHTLLFDCGEGTQSAARACHAPVWRADAICLTHYHGDHIFGLPGYLQTMGTLGRTEPLYLFGPDGLEDVMALLMQLCISLPYELRPVTLPAGGLRLCEVIPRFPQEARLTPIPTQHRVPSQGYRFDLSRAGKFLVENARALGVPQSMWGRLQKGETVEADGRIIAPADVLSDPRKGLSVVFTGDTTPCDAVLEGARGVDLLVMEATYGDDAHEALAREHGHSTFAATARLASQANVKQLCLVHFSGMVDDPSEYLPNAQAHFPGAIAGEDGMSFSLSFEE